MNELTMNYSISDSSDSVSTITKPFRLINHFQWEKGQYELITEKPYYHLLFLMLGKGEFFSSGYQGISLSEGEFMLIEKTSRIEFDVKEESELFILSFPEMPKVYEQSYLQQLMISSLHIIYQAPVLSIGQPIRLYLDFLKNYMCSEMDMEEIYPLKLKEIFLLIRYYYTRVEVMKLLYPIISSHPDFVQKVLENAPYAQNALELIRLTGMKRSTFRNKFREAFATSVHKWQVRQRVKEVVDILACPEYSISEARVKLKFNSSSHFVRFCRREFNCTPTQLRQQLLKNR